MLLCSLAAFPHIVSMILRDLEPRDLCALCCTSHDCRDLVLDDPQARKRRESYVKELVEIKRLVGYVSSAILVVGRCFNRVFHSLYQENWPIKKKSNDVPEESRTVFVDVKNIHKENASSFNHGSSGSGNSLSSRCVSAAKEKDKYFARRLPRSENKRSASEDTPTSSKRPYEDQENLGARDKVSLVECTPSTSRKKLAKTDSAGSEISKKRLRRL